MEELSEMQMHVKTKHRGERRAKNRQLNHMPSTQHPSSFSVGINNMSHDKDEGSTNLHMKNDDEMIDELEKIVKTLQK